VCHKISPYMGMGTAEALRASLLVMYIVHSIRKMGMLQVPKGQYYTKIASIMQFDG
jgi:hypothetical protein